MSDADVVRDVLGGRHDSFTTLVERHFTSIYALCLSYVKNTADAEDAAQDTFVKCYNRLDTLRNPQKFAGWLASIARNICLNRLKTHARRREVLMKVAENGMEQEHVVEAERAELRETVRRKVDELPPKTREAVYLYYFEEKSLKEIAAYLGKSPNAVARLLKYGRRLLKDKLWEEAADSIREMRPKKESVVAACAAIPLGQAPWCGTAAAAAGAGKVVTIGGVLAMNTKSVVSTIAVVAVVLTGLFVWSPWTEDQSAGPQKLDLISRAGLLALEPLEPQKELPEDEEQSARTEEAPAADQVPPVEEMEDPQEDEAAEYASVSGRVINDSGYPLDGADVRIEVSADRLAYEVEGVYDTKTSADGSYEINGIDVIGGALVYASADGYVMDKTGVDELSPGTVRDNVDFTLEKGRHFIAGWVVSQDREPISGASVNLRFHRGKWPYEKSVWIDGQPKMQFVITDEDGHFEMAIPREALCDFTVMKKGYGTGYFSEVRTGTDDAMFVLRAGGGIAGKVMMTDGSPVEGATVTVRGNAYPGGVSPDESKWQAQPLREIAVLTDIQGAYSVNGLGEDYYYSVAVENVVRKEGKVVLAAAVKEAVRVRAGKMTTGVDFVLLRLEGARIYGTVTDESSGQPACPVGVVARVIEPAADLAGDLQAHAETESDGSYDISLKLSEAAEFTIRWGYVPASNFYGGDEVTTLELAPGVERKLDFSVEAPITVPVRCIDEKRAPLEGITLGVRTGPAYYGSPFTTDADGRFVYSGLPPDETHRIVGRKGDGVVGESEPFSGKPGETVPEVEVVCISTGGIEGVLLDPDGNPVAHTEIGCTAVYDDGSVAEPAVTFTEDDGSFAVLNALPEGVYSVAGVGYVRDGFVYRAVAENIEIVAGSVTDLGTLTAEPALTVEEAQDILQEIE